MLDKIEDVIWGISKEQINNFANTVIKTGQSMQQAAQQQQQSDSKTITTNTPSSNSSAKKTSYIKNWLISQNKKPTSKRSRRDY